MGSVTFSTLYDTPGDGDGGKARSDSHWSPYDPVRVVSTLLLGVVSFAIIFAINSAVHSYLIVKYSDGNKVAMNVGFYYMANAFGRLIGTIVSGALYSYVGEDENDGLAACFLASSFFVVVSAVVSVRLDDDVGGFVCGRLCGGAAGTSRSCDVCVRFLSCQPRRIVE
eukprot:30761-Pelagococcus_subviridis.AAC.3